jgi:hypothetical protein
VTAGFFVPSLGLVDVFKGVRDDHNRTDNITTRDLLTPISSQPESESLLASSYTGLSQDLVKAWPAQADLARIYEFPIGLSTHSHMHIYTPSSALRKENKSTREMLRLPLPGSHPVLVARKLLFLGSILQGALSASHVPASLRNHFSGIMTRAIDTATRLVTTNDALTASIEGLECIMIEAMIQNYTGNLHRAWMTTRRGSAVAQALGLHQGSKSPLLKCLDAETNASFDPDQFCFRIVEMDRYLSITLGLPMSSLETRALTPEALAQCDPLDRMARQHCIIAGQMLSGERSKRSLEGLQEMEDELQKAANEMSPQWWLTPDLVPGDDTAANPFQEVARVNYQFSHYLLLLRAHLPYIMRYSPEYDHSRLAAAGASREMLARYVAFRRWNPGHFYCRGADYLAFIAVTVLCLVYVDARSTTEQDARSRTAAGKLLTANRLTDRGTMERTLGILKRMRSDATAIKLANIMQHLLDVEGNVADGARYSAVARDDNGAVECNGDLLDDQNTLQLNIPYFGTIQLQRKQIPNPGEATIPPQERGPNMPIPNCGLADPATSIVACSDQWYRQTISPYENSGFETAQGDAAEMFNTMPDWSDTCDLTMQNINESLFNSLFGGTGQNNLFNIGSLDNNLI